MLLKPLHIRPSPSILSEYAHKHSTWIFWRIGASKYTFVPPSLLAYLLTFCLFDYCIYPMKDTMGLQSLHLCGAYRYNCKLRVITWSRGIPALSTKIPKMTAGGLQCRDKVRRAIINWHDKLMVQQLRQKRMGTQRWTSLTDFTVANNMVWFGTHNVGAWPIASK